MNIPILAIPRTNAIFGLPLLFILMWSSGYVAGKMALPFVGPYTMIFLRFSIAAAVLLAVVFLTQAPWPRSWKELAHIAVVGVFIQALQFSGLYTGLAKGVSAGVSALIVGTMPLFVALGAGIVLKEKVSTRQWIGLGIGVFGVTLVVWNKLSFGASIGGYVAVVFALSGITIGTLYQKRFCSTMDLRSGGFIQLAVASVISFFAASAFEGLHFEPSQIFVVSVGWMALINSIGAISVLYILINQGDASKVASLFYLIPGVTAIMAFFLLDEMLPPIALVGFAITALGVSVSTRR